MKKIIIGLVIAIVAFAAILFFVLPNMVRVMGEKNAQFLASRGSTSSSVRFTEVKPTEILRRISASKKDTVIVHLWNSWCTEGTMYFDTLSRYQNDHSTTTELLHICTDMTGLRQMKAAAVIAESNGLSGQSYAIRSSASIFDLRNGSATTSFIEKILPGTEKNVSPTFFVFDRSRRTVIQEKL